MRRFYLVRYLDESGVSGEGRIAEGVEFSDGRVALHWVARKQRSTVVWDSLDDVIVIHGHGGLTSVSWIDPPQPPHGDI